MALYGIVVALQCIVIIATLVVFAMDLYFINTYSENKNVVLLARFFPQTGISGFWFFFFLISLIVLAVQHRRRLRTSGSPYPESVGVGAIIWSLFRAVFIVGTAAGMLYITVKALANENRSILVLPASRDSAQYKSLNDDFSRYDPLNLRHCPSENDSDSLSKLCPMDKAINNISILAAILVVVEVPFMLLFSLRSSSKREASA
ncbi:hypothetical protein BGX31_000160 [Mortierella sp. GBA43]|nr:hypothetical protein BGX31_000160 [Mortierella sp. GBA43]